MSRTDNVLQSIILGLSGVVAVGVIPTAIASSVALVEGVGWLVLDLAFAWLIVAGACVAAGVIAGIRDELSA